jgi:drug/metabolite transporter (DMT)-like permease
MGALNNALPFVLITLAQGRITGSEAAILNATTPLFTLIVATLVGQDQLGLSRVAGLAAGMVGVAVLLGTAPGGEAAAMALCLGAALSYAAAGVWGRGRLAALAPLSAAFGMLACAAVILTPLVFVHDRPWTLPPPPPAAWGAVLALALLGSAFAYRLYFRLLADVGAMNLLLVTFLVPVSAIAISVGVLGEAILPRHLVGLALILCGLVLASRRRAG